MKPILQKIKEDNKKDKNYSRIMTNRMTIVAWKLFKHSRTKHFGFILYRLRKDFGFTNWEIANLTGIPMSDINNYITRIKPVLDLEVLRILATMDEKGEIEAWKKLPDGHGDEQGRIVFQKRPAWYDVEKASFKRRKIQTKPYFQLGGDTEEEYGKKENKS